MVPITQALDPQLGFTFYPTLIGLVVLALPPILVNTHGGLLSYGHCGVGGAMAHLVETHLQMTGRAGRRQVRDASIALLHGDGGVLSSHVSMFLERVR